MANKKLKLLMDERGWNSRCLAAAAGVGQATVWRTVRGKTKPDLETLKKLSRALKVTVQDLMDEEKD